MLHVVEGNGNSTVEMWLQAEVEASKHIVHDPSYLHYMITASWMMQSRSDPSNATTQITPHHHHNAHATSRLRTVSLQL